jgi:ligand-binding sensor domain-containing protein
MKLIFVFCLIFSNVVYSQLAMNNWRVHFSLSSSVGITKTASKIYMAAANGIVVYDSEDNSISNITHANGLSDIGVSSIGSNDNVVIVGYNNGNIDVIEGNITTNIPWLKKAQLSGLKVINDFYFNDNIIYISTSIGIIVYDIQKKEIKDTYYPVIGSEINDLCFFNDSIYAATNNGIYTAGVNQSYLNDFTNWTKKTNLPPTILNSRISEIESFNNYLFIGYDDPAFGFDSIFKMNTANQINFFKKSSELTNISVYSNELLISDLYNLSVFDKSLSSINGVFDYSFGTDLSIIGATKFNDEYWVADKRNGLVRAYDSWNNQQIFNNTPFKNLCYRIDVQYGKMAVAGGALTHNYQNNYYRAGLYLFENESWKNINYTNDSGMDYNTTWDVISVSINPNNTSQIALGTYSKGGLKIIEDGKIIQTFTADNSLLEEQMGNNGAIIISDLKYDNDGNLWVVNPGANPLKMLSKDGVWYAFNVQISGSPYPTRLLIDSKGNKWISFIGSGIAVFNENATPSDLSDDKLVKLGTTEGYGNLPSTNVKSIAEDIDGEIWIGTEEGLTIVYATDKIFDGNYGDADANQIKLEYGGNVEHLLGTSSITSIAVDGGNRKWIGTTSSGVFCFSPNGLEEIYRFTAENSPLLSNTILDIKINHQTGEVFFATENGLISYRADATIGDEKFENISVFPNPVRPNYRGNITIQGLAYNSDVKVTDVSGNLIYQTKSNGGTVVWDGNRLNGERVQSGVYLIWTASSTGKGKNVAKVVVMN